MFEKRLYVQEFVINRVSGKLESVSQIDLVTALHDLEVARLNKVYGENNSLEIIKNAFAFNKGNERLVYIYIGEIK